MGGRVDPAGQARLLAEATAFVAELEGVVAGWTCLIEAAHELDQLYVAPTAGGRGVGRALLAEAEAAARTAGLTQLDARVSRRARGTFAAAGYLPVRDEVVTVGAQRLERTQMRKRL